MHTGVNELTPESQQQCWRLIAQLIIFHQPHYPSGTHEHHGDQSLQTPPPHRLWNSFPPDTRNIDTLTVLNPTSKPVPTGILTLTISSRSSIHRKEAGSAK